MATNLTVYSGNVPDKQNDTPTAFADNVFAYQTWIDASFVPEFNTAMDSIVTDITTINGYMNTTLGYKTTTEGYVSTALTYRNEAEAFKDLALNTANFLGDWVANYNTVGYPQGSTVVKDGWWYTSKTDDNLEEPLGVETTNWYYHGITAKAIGNINNPLLDLPLNNSLAMKQGVGSVTFTRASTATYIDRYGVLQYSAIDEPRFEKDGILIEGLSTNMFTYSNDFANAIWSKYPSVVLTPSYGVAPDGTTTSTRLQCNALEGIYQTHSSSTDNTLSIWVKGTAGTEIRLSPLQGANVTYILQTDEWERVQETATGNGTSTTAFISAGSIAIDVEIWGGQLEELPFASSYIPTTTAQVTRSAEYCEVTYNENHAGVNSAEYSYVVDASIIGLIDNFQVAIGVDVSYHVLALSDTANSEASFYNSASGASRVVATLPSVDTANRYGVTVNNTTNSVYIDGAFNATAELNADASGTPTKITLGYQDGLGRHLFGHIKNFKGYDMALSSTEIGMA